MWGVCDGVAEHNQLKAFTGALPVTNNRDAQPGLASSELITSVDVVLRLQASCQRPRVPRKRAHTVFMYLLTVFPSLSDRVIVTLESWPLGEGGTPNSVHVRMLMAPINPADINQIEGTYAFIPPRPFVAGNEGVGEVLSVGPAVQSLRPGDWVIPAVAGLGTWRPELICPAESLLRVPTDLPVEAAATILVNPCTAYRMLEDFVELKAGDVVIQNGANSAVGRAVIQLAAARGIKTVNVVRDRPNYEALEQELRALGATMVVKAERLPLPETQAHLELVLGGRPLLALNCVGGQAATDLARTLSPSGTLVTYGGMSRRPVTLPTGLLIFNDIRATGFWVSAWYKRQHDLAAQGDDSLTVKRERMMAELAGMLRSGKLALPPSRTHQLADWRQAMEQATSPYTGLKELFKF